MSVARRVMTSHIGFAGRESRRGRNGIIVRSRSTLDRGRNQSIRSWAALRRAKVAELADAPDLGSGGETHGGSTPPFRTKKRNSPFSDRLQFSLTSCPRGFRLFVANATLTFWSVKLEPKRSYAAAAAASTQASERTRCRHRIDIPLLRLLQATAFPSPQRDSILNPLRQ
jgi:hypothetical protein